MGWDVEFSKPGEGLGNKEKARETFISACESITGKNFSRRGPTEVPIDDSFVYEVIFIGDKWAITEITLSFKVSQKDESDSSIMNFIKQLCEHTGWEAYDTYTGTNIQFEKD